MLRSDTGLQVSDRDESLRSTPDLSSSSVSSVVKLSGVTASPGRLIMLNRCMFANISVTWRDRI